MPNNNGFSYSKGTDKTNMTQEIKNNLEESSNNFLSNVMDSASTNFKKNINDVSLVDVAVKTPKGVAIEVGLKTLKDTANDVLNSFSKQDEHLDKLVKDYDSKIKVSLLSINSINSDGKNDKYLCDLKYEHENGDVFKEFSELSKSEFLKILGDSDIRNYTENLSQEEEDRLIESVYATNKYFSNNHYSIYIDEAEKKYTVLFSTASNIKYLGESELSNIPSTNEEYADLLENFRESNNIKDIKYYHELIDNTNDVHELMNINEELRDNSVKKVFFERHLDKVELLEKSDKKIDAHYENVKKTHKSKNK